MKRREFITLLGSGAVTWPLATRAQQPAAKLLTIGFIGPSTASADVTRRAAFAKRLGEFGWIDGRNLTIEYRWAEGVVPRAGEIAAEYAQQKVDVIVVSGDAQVLAAKRATAAIPIVIAAAADPVGNGLVESLARPGGNVTGMSRQLTDSTGKRLEVLQEFLPGIRRVAILFNAANPLTAPELNTARAAAANLGLDTVKCEIRRAEDVVPAIEIAQEPGRCTLRLRRPAGEYQRRSHQFAGAGGAAADHAQLAGQYRRRRHDLLRARHHRPVSACRRICRQDPARCQAGRSSGRTANQVRTGDQSPGRQIHRT